MNFSSDLRWSDPYVVINAHEQERHRNFLAAFLMTQ
jgi:hypothetical protein